ncbi:MAG: DNA repair protein RadC [Candidatus Falkowbacteria bacterium]
MPKYQIKTNEMLTMSITDRQYVMKVADLPDEEKPREKLIASGPRGLSTTELLAVVLGTGTKKEEVMNMSSRLLREYGEKNIINQMSPAVISCELDIPLAKSCQLVACFELGRRFFQKKSEGLNNIRCARQAFDYLTDMRNLNKEQFRGLYLNSRYQLIHDETISIGSINASIVHPREVFKPAIQYGATAIIVAHNHPSGGLKASAEDREVTEKLKEAGRILGIEVLDHIIIADNRFISIL